MTATKTTTDLAADFDTDPRTLRKFLRSADSGIEPVGKGKRYSLPGTKTELTKLRKKFDSWTAAREAERKAAAEAAAAEAQEAPEALELDEAGDEAEPTPEELEALEIDDES